MAKIDGAALKSSQSNISDIDYINAHGTSTMADTIELGAVGSLAMDYSSKISMSSQNRQSVTYWGRSVEAIFNIINRDQIVPPTKS